MTDPGRLERYLDDFGAQLVSAAAKPQRGRWLRRRRPLAVVLAATVAAGVAIVLAAPGERSFDPVAEARAALAPPGEIVYMKITSTHIAPGANSVPPPQTTEQWSALDPPRWRFVQHLPSSGSRVGSIVGRRFVPLSGRQELSYAHGVTRSYLGERDTLHVTRGYRDSDPGTRLPSVLGQGSGDPSVDLRSMLLQGEVSDMGEQQLRGRTVRRFVIEQRRSSANDPPTVRRMVYDVDPRTFAPVEGRFSLTLGRPGLPARITTRMHVDAYRRIPLTATTEKLLQIKSTPQTQSTFDTAQRLRARARAWRARCRPIQNGRALACPPPEGRAASP